MKSILAVISLSLVACVETASLQPLGNEAAFEDPCIYNDQTSSASAALVAQGFSWKGSRTQQVVESSWGDVLYWRNVTAERYQHPDGRIKYATCRGIVGYDVAMGTQHQVFVDNPTSNGRCNFALPDWYPATLVNFGLGGVTGWDERITVRFSLPYENRGYVAPPPRAALDVIKAGARSPQPR